MQSSENVKRTVRTGKWYFSTINAEIVEMWKKTYLCVLFLLNVLSRCSLSTLPNRCQPLSDHLRKCHKPPVDKISQTLYNNHVRVQKQVLSPMQTITGPPKYQQLLESYYQQQCSIDDGIALFQFLLDTDQCWDCDILSHTASYLLAEGYCYYVYCP